MYKDCLVALLLVLSPQLAKAKKVAIPIKALGQINTRAPETNDEGTVIYMRKYSQLERGNTIVNFFADERDIIRNDNGSINLLETARRYRTRENLTPIPYNTRGDSLPFFPIQKINSITRSLHYVALESLALSGNNLAVATEEDVENYLINVSGSDLVRFNNYQLIYDKFQDANSCYPIFAETAFGLNYRLLEEISSRCKENPDENGFADIYSASFYDRYSRAYKIEYQRETKDFEKIANQCKEELQHIACNTSPWYPELRRGKKLTEDEKFELGDQNLKQRFEATAYAANLASDSYGVNPFLYACMAAKETSYLDPMMRTATSCDPRPECIKLPNQGGDINKCAAYDRGLSASGLGQVTLGTIRDLIGRAIISFHPSSENSNFILLKKLFNKHLRPQDMRLLEKSHKGIVYSDEAIFDYKCPTESKCGEIAERLWSHMANSIELQAALSLIILSESNFDLFDYYGGENGKGNYYRNSIQNCLSCIHQKKVVEEGNLHRCLIRATDDRVRICNNYIKRNTIRDCKCTGSAKKPFCYSLLDDKLYRDLALEFYGHHDRNCNAPKPCKEKTK